MKDYITVRKALEKCDLCLLKKEIEKHYPDTSGRSVYATLVYAGQLMMIAPKRNCHKSFAVTVPHIYFEEGKMHTEYNSFMCFRADIAPSVCPPEHDYKIEELSGKSLDELEEIRRSFPYMDYTEHYDLIFTPPEEILSYYIPRLLAERYGMEVILAEFLYEMTFNGFDVRKIEKNNKKLLEDRENPDNWIKVDSVEEMLRICGIKRKRKPLPEPTPEEQKEKLIAEIMNRQEDTAVHNILASVN